MGDLYDWTDWVDCLDSAARREALVFQFSEEAIAQINELGQQVWDVYNLAKLRVEEINSVQRQSVPAPVPSQFSGDKSLHDEYIELDALDSSTFNNSDVNAKMFQRSWGKTPVYEFIGALLQFIDAFVQDLSDVFEEPEFREDFVFKAQMNTLRLLVNTDIVPVLREKYGQYITAVQVDATLCLEEKKKRRQEKERENQELKGRTKN